MNQQGKITLMLFVFAICGSAALVNYRWQRHVDQTRPAELYSVVYSQLVAFRADNFSLAYREASSGVQQKFNIDQFAEMVRNDFSVILRAERVEFGFVESDGRRAVIQVFLVDKVGQVTPCVYTLISEGHGWKIEGARVMRRWPAGARLGGIWS